MFVFFLLRHTIHFVLLYHVDTIVQNVKYLSDQHGTIQSMDGLLVAEALVEWHVHVYVAALLKFWSSLWSW